MINNKFIRRKVEYLTLEQIIEITQAKLEDNNIDLKQKIFGVSGLESAQKNEISFLSSGKYSDKLSSSKAGFCLIAEELLCKKPKNMVALIHQNSYFAYANLLNYFYEENINGNNLISKNAIIEDRSNIGKNVTIMPGAFIGNNVKIGDNSYIGVNSVINDDVEIGNNSIIHNLVNISHSIIGSYAIIHPGAKIGQDGFGFAHDNGINYKIMQLGMVKIGDYVEIGSNSCVDRGTIENTIIHNQVKLDNFVQIAHNVEVGQGTVLAGGARVAGSTKIGKFCQIGGNASVSGHIDVGDFAKIAGMSGVVRSVGKGQSVGGLPAVSIRDWHKMTIKLLKLIKS